MTYPHLNLISEALSNIQRLMRIPQYYFKSLLETQLPPNSGQSPVGPRCQSQRGDSQQDHVTMVGGTMLGSGEQRLHNLQGLHGGVFVEVVGGADSAGRGHQSYAVVLNQNCSPDHSTVQLRKPGRKMARNAIKPCEVLGRWYSWSVSMRSTFLPGRRSCSQRRSHSASEAGCRPIGSTPRALTRQSTASSRGTGPHPSTNTRNIYIYRCELTAPDRHVLHTDARVLHY